MMKTHNAIIYHCLGCGNVVHRDPGLEAPSCCGKTMVKAAAETIVENETKRADEASGASPGIRQTNPPKPR
jgi:hypothetical protein